MSNFSYQQSLFHNVDTTLQFYHDIYFYVFGIHSHSHSTLDIHHTSKQFHHLFRCDSISRLRVWESVSERLNVHWMYIDEYPFNVEPMEPIELKTWCNNHIPNLEMIASSRLLVLFSFVSRHFFCIQAFCLKMILRKFEVSKLWFWASK